MSAPIDGGPAFPQSLTFSPEGNARIVGEYFPYCDGLSIRDWFAGMALSGEIASTSTAESVEATARAAAINGRSATEQIAFNCYEMADAMIAARNGKEVA